MKTKIFTFLVVLIGGLFMATNVFADNNISVSPGQTVTYSIKEAFTSYDWKVTTDAEYMTAAETSDYTLTVTGQSVTILWKAPSAGKTYYVSVQGTDSKGCFSERISKKVDVSSPTVCIAKSTTFGTSNLTTVAPTGTSDGVCSLLASSTSGSSTTTGGQTTFYATLTGGISGVSYQFTYQVGPNSEETSPAVTANASGEAVLAITVEATTYPVDFTATSNDKTVTVKVTGLKVGGETITKTCDAPDSSYDVTVNKIPTISF